MPMKQAMEDNKSDIGWGSQIRSYVLDDSRIKDLRTGRNPQHAGRAGRQPGSIYRSKFESRVMRNQHV